MNFVLCELDESMPGTPTSPTGSHNSMALSVSSSNTVPIARGEKHVVLAMSPARPKVSSMQSKLDHTKIDTSLYDQVFIDLNELLQMQIDCYMNNDLFPHTLKREWIGLFVD